MHDTVTVSVTVTTGDVLISLSYKYKIMTEFHYTDGTGKAGNRASVKQSKALSCRVFSGC